MTEDDRKNGYLIYSRLENLFQEVYTAGLLVNPCVAHVRADPVTIMTLKAYPRFYMQLDPMRSVDRISWRGMGFVALVTPAKLSPDMAPDEEPPEVGFCLTIAVEKPNGRFEYFDDPDTEEGYL